MKNHFRPRGCKLEQCSMWQNIFEDIQSVLTPLGYNLDSNPSGQLFPITR